MYVVSHGRLWRARLWVKATTTTNHNWHQRKQVICVQTPGRWKSNCVIVRNVIDHACSMWTVWHSCHFEHCYRIQHTQLDANLFIAISAACTCQTRHASPSRSLCACTWPRSFATPANPSPFLSYQYRYIDNMCALNWQPAKMYSDFSDTKKKWHKNMIVTQPLYLFLSIVPRRIYFMFVDTLLTNPKSNLSKLLFFFLGLRDHYAVSVFSDFCIFLRVRKGYASVCKLRRDAYRAHFDKTEENIARAPYVTGDCCTCLLNSQ